MSDEVLIAILLLSAGCHAWTFIWIAGHHKACHSAPSQAIAALTQRVTGCEEEEARLAQNAHDDRDVISVAVLDLVVVFQHLGLQQAQHKDIPKKLRELAANLEANGRPRA